MSVPSSRRLPDRPSLEQLRKQAKEHLDTLRATDPSATLSTAQHALAREYGFENWPALWSDFNSPGCNIRRCGCRSST
jgi:hypothetical protein